MESREAEVLKTRRLELGLSQQEVAVEAGMHIRQYQRFEYGERSLMKCTLDVGLRLCAVLELNPYELLFENE